MVMRPPAAEPTRRIGGDGRADEPITLLTSGPVRTTGSPRADFILARSSRAPVGGRSYDCSPTASSDPTPHAARPRSPDTTCWAIGRHARCRRLRLEERSWVFW
jgi:hypothetical protein